jgi:hypothetical protein
MRQKKTSTNTVKKHLNHFYIRDVKPFRELLLVCKFADELNELNFKYETADAISSGFAKKCDGSSAICHHPPEDTDFIG